MCYLTCTQTFKISKFPWQLYCLHNSTLQIPQFNTKLTLFSQTFHFHESQLISFSFPHLNLSSSSSLHILITLSILFQFFLLYFTFHCYRILNDTVILHLLNVYLKFFLPLFRIYFTLWFRSYSMIVLKQSPLKYRIF